MSRAPDKAKSWVCDQCKVSVGQIDGELIPLPGSWASSAEGQFCLLCRRERAGTAALEAAPSDSPREARVRLRRAALIEFEVRRTPDHSDGAIAKTCRTSVSAVAQARSRLRVPDPPSPSSGKLARANRREPVRR
jgi:hypothetical protein